MSAKGREVEKGTVLPLVVEFTFVHHQGFGTHPVDDILETIPQEIARIKNEMHLTALVSRWDKKGLATQTAAQKVDVTDQLIEAFHPSERQRRHAIEIQAAKPVPSFLLELMFMKEGH
jgi:hypothetical protein